MELYRIEDPKALAVSIEETADAVGIDVPGNLIQRATDIVEAETGECLIRQCWALDLRVFPGRKDSIVVPIGPYLSAQVHYKDIDGELAVCNSGDLMFHAYQGGFYIAPAPGVCWPQTQAGAEHPVHVVAWVGIGDNSEVIPLEKKRLIYQVIRDILADKEEDEDRPDAP